MEKLQFYHPQGKKSTKFDFISIYVIARVMGEVQEGKRQQNNKNKNILGFIGLLKTDCRY